MRFSLLLLSTSNVYGCKTYKIGLLKNCFQVFCSTRQDFYPISIFPEIHLPDQEGLETRLCDGCLSSVAIWKVENSLNSYSTLGTFCKYTLLRTTSWCPTD